MTSLNSEPYNTSDREAIVESTIGQFYNTTDMAAIVITTNSATFNTSDSPARLTGTTTAPYNNTPGNNTLNIGYTNNTVSEYCSVTLFINNSLSLLNVTTSINDACNLTASGTTSLILTTHYPGPGEWINLSTSNASTHLGLTTGYNYTGYSNNTVNMAYTNRTVVETCNVTLPKSNALSAVGLIANFTNGASCNLSLTGDSVIRFNTHIGGSGEYIKFETGNALDILGLTSGITYTGYVNNTLNFKYSNRTITEICNVTFEKSDSLTLAHAASNISTKCNVSVSNVSTSSIYFTTLVTGPGEWIKFDASGTLGIMGFTQGVNYTGYANNTLNFEYSVNGTLEYCNVSLTKHTSLNASGVVGDIQNTGCNVTMSNTSTVNILGTGYGNDEFIAFSYGTATDILGFSGYDDGEQTNISSSTKWFEIQDTDNLTVNNFMWLNDSGHEAMRLNKDTGDLTIFGMFTAENFSWSNITESTFPAACPSGSAVTELGDTSTCTSYVDVARFNSTEYWSGGYQGMTTELRITDSIGICYMNFTDGLFTSTNCTEI